ncbi:hypothetical protein ACFS5L_42520 [Streptomyces phyllanthi]|uniref:Uncharacterized protein n=1 Tax=Streptomyces phyllanthi TaxID=1803180 RepID=A0A5N8VUU8_9ACTN|nr:hypothetical protein [Streptomyces phyllanthi]MPY39030.1 hypothetical protein [Streptomyces phyllanthi]
MIKSAVRGAVVTALTATFALLPSLAHAEEKDKDNDIERVELTGINAFDTMPGRIRTGDSWVAHLELYAKKTGKPGKKKHLTHVGDGESECSAVRAHGDWVTMQCTRTLRLKKGTLTLSDMITYNRWQSVTAKTAVTGGTGHYRSAYGDGYITLAGRYVHLELNVDE